MVDVGLKGNLEIKSITIYRAIASTFQFKKSFFVIPRKQQRRYVQFVFTSTHIPLTNKMSTLLAATGRI